MTITVRLIFPDGNLEEKKFVNAKSCGKIDEQTLTVRSHDNVIASFNWRYVWEVIEKDDDAIY